MSVTVVVGGQYGSEGKGKVALDFARRRKAAAVVRVGGTNSGHTGVGDDGTVFALRQLPAAALAPDTLVILPPGALIDIDLFVGELALLRLAPERVKVDPKATVISEDDKETERAAGLAASIGSTGSGTGAALQRRIQRSAGPVGVQAEGYPALRPYLAETTALMRDLLHAGERIVVEGTQGFGLSLLHGPFYPKSTSRDTTAGTFIGEAGLSPVDVDQVVLVIRTFPIRVAGASGPLKGEISWEELALRAGLPSGYRELSTATGRVRRIGEFDPEIVRKAIAVNSPTDIVLNHLDYISASVRKGIFGPDVDEYICRVEASIGREISLIGTSPQSVMKRGELDSSIAA